MKNFSDIRKECIDHNHPSVILCTIREYNNSKSLNKIERFLKKQSNFNYYKCNISNKANAYLKYILQIEDLNALVFLSPNGDIQYYQDSLTNYKQVLTIFSLVTKDSYNKLLSRDSSNYLTSLMDIHPLEILPDNRLSKSCALIDSLSNIYSDYYLNYLGYKLHKKAQNLTSSELYMNMLKSFYEVPQIYSYIELDISREVSNSSSPVLKCNTNIKLPKIKRGETYEVEIPVTNDSNTPLIIIDDISNCDCIKLTYPKITNPKDSAIINLTYTAKDNELLGTFSKSVSLITNTYKEREILFINGEIIK
ncbi:MAG: DUF1573 domain-containing protein [Bacteroidales bacterium]|nr:DUF1573 domain-containing protein [Bacteroidales bacterium]